MRLICPGCGAQYEVDDGVIPDAGRDVQCSACGQVWFQKSRPILLSDNEAVGELSSHWESPPAPRPEPGARPPLPPVEAIDQVMSETFEEDIEPPLPPEGMSPAPAPGLVPRRPLDESLLSILREEAEREARARRADTGGLETQAEMDLAPAEAEPLTVSPPAPVPRLLTGGGVMAQATTPVPPPPIPPEPDPVEPLPDISAISSTLRARADRADAPIETPTPEEGDRTGFRTGFLMMMALAAVAVAAYGFAPELGLAVPALHPGLQDYAATVDAGRVWLDGTLRMAIEAIQAAVSG